MSGPSAWACYAHLLPTGAVPCHATGTDDRAAERHTRATGHPTTSGTPSGVQWAVRA